MKVSRRGLIGTLIIHGLVLALLILGGLTFPDPPPEEDGIMVNFGTDDTGYGFVEPKGDEANQGNPEPEVTEYIPEEVVQNSPPDPVYEDTPPADNTQDVEEVVVKEDPKPTAEEIRQQQEKIERINKKKEEERLVRVEQERIDRVAEAERQRVEEERLKKEKQADKINKLGQNTFGRQGVGETEGSQGVKPGDGTNQGVVTGTPGATNYGDGSGLGDGASFGLGGRKVVGDLPKPNVEDCVVTSRIVVRVEIQVDRSGNVMSASVLKATFSDNCIWNVVIQAARETKFSSNQNAAFKQTGWIEYTIEP
jgi:colicin import membrane protein